MTSVPTDFPPLLVRRALRQIRAADPVMESLIDRVGPFRMRLQTNRFESLARAIVAQQISASAAKSIWRKLQTELKPRRVTPAALAVLDDFSLRGAGVSPQKLAYLRDLQQKVSAREVRLHRVQVMSDGEVVEELTRVKGVGVWTAQMFLMFSLGRPDVLPHQDLGIRAALRRLYGLQDLPDRETCESLAQPWRPYATIACWYCWRSSELSPQ